MNYGLIGEKLGHSYSKLIQERLLDDYLFEIHPIAREDLDSFMKKKEFKGINVTIPYKQDVVPYLDEMDDASTKIGAVNTIVNDNGRLIGHNTDYSGFRYMLERHCIVIENKKVLVMGNGGASKAIQAVLNDLNAKQLLIVDIILADGILSIEEVYQNHTDVDVIVNTTPIGMYPKVHSSCVDIEKFQKLQACVDVVYNPFATEFILQAKKRGLIGVTGLEMLVAQAKYALEFFKNIKISDKEIDRIYKEILATTTNIVLVGMPGAGKTTLGKSVAEELGKEFIDTDACILEKTGMTSQEYYKAHGEEPFRAIEADIIESISTKTNCVIACGGGAILNPSNIHNLKRNGFILYIDRDQTELSNPIALDKDVQTIYEERSTIYKQVCDAHIQNTRVEETLSLIIQGYTAILQKQ